MRKQTEREEVAANMVSFVVVQQICCNETKSTFFLPQIIIDSDTGVEAKMKGDHVQRKNNKILNEQFNNDLSVKRRCSSRSGCIRPSKWY